MPLVKLPSAWRPILCDHQRGRNALSARRTTSARVSAMRTGIGRRPPSSGALSRWEEGAEDIRPSVSRQPRSSSTGAASTSLNALRPLVGLLHEEDDRRRAPAAGPPRNRADQVLCDAASARLRIDPHRDQLHLERVDADESADDAEPIAILLGDEERLLL